MLNKKVLVCEDDEGIIEIAQIVLTDAGYEVHSAMSKVDIWDAIRGWKPDVILLDLWMPEVSGAELTHQLKQDPFLQKIPIIIVSASRETEKIARQAGANDFLYKPFDINTLEERVAKYCSR
jgi:CheY-like chemotaxis protein